MLANVQAMSHVYKLLTSMLSINICPSTMLQQLLRTRQASYVTGWIMCTLTWWHASFTMGLVQAAGLLVGQDIFSKAASCLDLAQLAVMFLLGGAGCDECK